MPKGIAAMIGLNSVDPGHYQGWSGDLVACEYDAQDMAAIAKSMRFDTTTLLTRDATRKAVLARLSAAAQALNGEDMFLLTYSGHGGQVPDLGDDEPDAMDETWCLFDGELLDDEIYKALGAFRPGVRILVLSDSCHSGSVIKEAILRNGRPVALPVDARGVVGFTPDRTVYRAMPMDVASRTYRANREFYDAIQSKLETATRPDVEASAILISGCQDNQLSADGAFNGLFTSNLLRVWKEGAFVGDYRDFHKAIVNRMPPDQAPNYFVVGSANPSFESQKPFTV